MGPMRLLKTSAPGSLSHILHYLEFITSNPERIQTSKPKSRHNCRSVGQSVCASYPSSGARPDLCALNITASQSWVLRDHSVSLATVVSHLFFGCTNFIFSIQTVYTDPSSVQVSYTKYYLTLLSALSNNSFVTWSLVLYLKILYCKSFRTVAQEQPAPLRGLRCGSIPLRPLSLVTLIMHYQNCLPYQWPVYHS
jgi:hypothetical protein